MTKNYFRVLLGVAASIVLASNASASLANSGFEAPALGGGDFQCLGGTCPGWTDFGAAFILAETAFPAGGVDGGQVLKVFGGESGVYQDLDATEGQVWDASVSAMNAMIDPMGGAQVAAINIEWIAGGVNIGTVFGSAINAGTPLDTWTVLTASGVAPAGTEFARIVLITGNFSGDPGSGSAFFDAASLEQRVVPIPAALWLMGSGLVGLIGLRRKKA